MIIAALGLTALGLSAYSIYHTERRIRFLSHNHRQDILTNSALLYWMRYKADKSAVYSIVCLDYDGMKSWNSWFKEYESINVHIRKAVGVLRNFSLRPGDVMGQWAEGDEVIIVLKQSRRALPGAIVAQRFADAMAERRLSYLDAQGISELAGRAIENLSATQVVIDGINGADLELWAAIGMADVLRKKEVGRGQIYTR